MPWVLLLPPCLPACLVLACFFFCPGTFLGGATMLRYGRRKAIALQALFFVAGPLIMAAAGSTA